MQKKTTIFFTGMSLLAMASSGLTAAGHERSARDGRSICLSTGPVENIALSGVEGGPVVDFQLAARFVTLNILNNSKQEVRFGAKVFQIDGLGTFEGGSWPSTGLPKIERFSGTRTPVVAQGSAILTADLGDDPESSFAYEGQIKVTGLTRRLKREEVLATAHSRRDEDLRINPEHRITNTEWTEIPCTW